ncbi:hypothetical protein OIU79_004440 [Salix purpurea]|uniref:Uncharacterized protein n=1 Tax=Salix purpurea TaxID=77065 RepID=A0A9Q0UAA6_SALPP|nr:hypothetical protein OIU79_004440 [Salix purpurea]
MAVINKTETKELGLSKKTRNSQITFENTGRVVGVLFRRLQFQIRRLAEANEEMWSLIAGRLPGRTDNEVKNYWNSHLRRKLIKMGIDPNNHRLRQNLLRPHNPQHPATASSSSGLKTHQAIQQPTKSHVDKEQVSDAVSCLEDDTCALPDLNLDLTMSFHSPSAPDVEGNPKDSRPQLDTAPSPTLLLFQ